MKLTHIILAVLLLSGCHTSQTPVLTGFKYETFAAGCQAVADDIGNGTVTDKTQALEAFRMETANVQGEQHVEAVERELEQTKTLEEMRTILQRERSPR